MKNLTDSTNYIFYSFWICFAVLNFASTSEQTNNEIVHWRVGLWTRWTQPPMNEKTTATTTTTKVQNINTLHLVKIVPALCHGIDNSTIYCNLIRIHMLLWLRKKMYMYSLLLLGYCCSAIGGCEYSYICIYIYVCYYRLLSASHVTIFDWIAWAYATVNISIRYCFIMM